VSKTLTEQLEQQQRELSREVYAAGDEARFPAELAKTACVDEAFTKSVQESFRKSADGRIEALRLQVDILRRARLASRPEAIFRSFGAVRLIAPVRQEGRTVFVVDGGLIKLGPWTLPEKETFAKICGVPVQKLPSELFQPTLFTEAQIPLLLSVLEKQARLLEAWLGREPAPSANTSAADPRMNGAALDILQPGFADHLDLLFGRILRESQSATPDLPCIRAAAQRGAHLSGQLRRISSRSMAREGNVSIHEILEHWTRHLREQSGVRFTLSLNARQAVVSTHPAAMQHLIYTLLAGVADGLPEGSALVGISTRDIQQDGVPCLHVELRDSGGLATFAELSPGLETDLIEEQNDAADEFSDWVSMAERMDARLQILRDRNVITRVDLFLPLQGPASSPDNGANRLRVWTVLENDAEAETLRRLLEENDVEVERMRSGAELQSHFVNAPLPPHLVMLDYLLSDIRGAALRTWLYEQDPDLPVIIMSGFSLTHPGVATASNLPSTLFLQKPFDAQSLYDMLRMTVNETLPGA